MYTQIHIQLLLLHILHCTYNCCTYIYTRTHVTHTTYAHMVHTYPYKLYHTYIDSSILDSTPLYSHSLIQPISIRYYLYAAPYIYTLYIPMLYITHYIISPYYITTLYMYLYYYIPAHTLHTYISTPLYKHSLITISHICHTQAPYKYIDIWGINRPNII